MASTAPALPNAGRNGAHASFLYRHDDGRESPVRMRRIVTSTQRAWEVDPADWFMFADGWHLVSGEPLLAGDL